VTPEELASRLAPSGRGEAAHGQTTVDVDPPDWVGALTRARDELGFGYFDWLTAVDQLAEGFDVVAHLWSLQRREHLLLRTRVPPTGPRLATATGVFAGASWHERETFEMFGIDFAGHAHLVPTASRATPCARTSCSPPGRPRRGREPRSRASPTSRDRAPPVAARPAPPAYPIRTHGVRAHPGPRRPS